MKSNAVALIILGNFKSMPTVGMATRHHDTSTPRQPQTNGMAELAVKSVIQGTRAVLHNSGLGHEWWKEAMQAWCCGRNFSTRPCHGVAATLFACTDFSPHEVHFGASFNGHLVPYGIRIFWECLKPDLNNSAAKFDETIRAGLFMGYHLHSGGRWSGDYLVIGTATYAKNPVGEHCRVH
eukprot:1955426-Pyramimonas_sp.AAC.1